LGVEENKTQKLPESDNCSPTVPFLPSNQTMQAVKQATHCLRYFCLMFKFFPPPRLSPSLQQGRQKGIYSWVLNR